MEKKVKKSRKKTKEKIVEKAEETAIPYKEFKPCFLKSYLCRLRSCSLQRGAFPKLISLAVLIILLAGFLADFATNSSLSANFADTVLRPLIGSKNTIFLESLVFGGQDSLNQLTYRFITPANQLADNFTTSQDIQAQKDMDLTPLSLLNPNFTPLPGEGSWQPINSTASSSGTILAQTFIRPDSNRAYAIVSLVKINMKKLRLSAVAGTAEPGGPVGRWGPGKIPPEIQNSNKLVAAFNGGFQEKDGQYGMVVGDKTYLPLKKGLATLVIDKNSNLKIVDYEGQDLGLSNIAIRQNGQMLISNSKIIPASDDNQFSTSARRQGFLIWGRTVTKSMYTWRSGIGITKNGNLIYAAGPSLVPETLAQALLQAGAVNGMQLDINPYWVRFIIYNPIGQGKYKHYALLKNMPDGGEAYLHGYQKDFFYLYER